MATIKKRVALWKFIAIYKLGYGCKKFKTFLTRMRRQRMKYSLIYWDVCESLLKKKSVMWGCQGSFVSGSMSKRCHLEYCTWKWFGGLSLGCTPCHIIFYPVVHPFFISGRRVWRYEALFRPNGKKKIYLLITEVCHLTHKTRCVIGAMSKHIAPIIIILWWLWNYSKQYTSNYFWSLWNDRKILYARETHQNLNW